MTKDEEQKLYRSWEEKWQAMNPWQRYYHIRRVEIERNLWACFLFVLALWQVGFGAWVWGNSDPWPRLAFLLGLAVLGFGYSIMQDLQRFLNWTKSKNS